MSYLHKRMLLTQDESPYLTLVYDTTLGNTTIELQLKGTVDATIRWGDETSEAATAAAVYTHTYATDGTYTVQIEGTCTGFGYSGSNSIPELVACKSFGQIGLTNLSFAFNRCANLTEVPKKLPNGVTTLQNCFQLAQSFNQDISGWDVSNVTNMSGMFNSAVSFDQDIGSWDVSSVTDFSLMFQNTSFNRDIGGWDIRSALTLSDMFNGATNFNQDISAWDPVNALVMTRMFNNTPNFNQNLTSWCVAYLTAAPTGFATASALAPENYPIWGTCPLYEIDGDIELVGSYIASGSTGVIPAVIQPGDIIIAAPFSETTSLAPTQASGWTTITTSSGTVGTAQFRTAYKVLDGTETDAGTWTGAAWVITLQYRNANALDITRYDVTTAGSLNNNMIFGNMTDAWRNMNWVVAFGMHVNAGTIPTPTGLTYITGTSADMTVAAYHSNGVNDVWESTTSVFSGTTGSWRTAMIRMRNNIRKIV